MGQFRRGQVRPVPVRSGAVWQLWLGLVGSGAIWHGSYGTEGVDGYGKIG